jgi:tetratricopeptide (TPR) repeat protein
MILMHIGLLDEAREGLDAALSAQPEDAMTLCALSQAALFQGQVEQSEEYMARAMGADSTLWLNHVFRPMISIYQNDFGRAERSLRTARQLVRDDAMLEASEALLWAKRGEARQAEEALRRATREKPSVAHLHHMSHLAACALAVLGRPSEAIARIREASRTGLPNFSAFRSDPHFQSLRGEPEMASLMSELERECAEYRREFGRA